ncbi:lysozyme inhibitor LprI family protein [Azospirillum sp. B506]|uniref:lysozyme inhibitor LprI family protein n=1 Tax=Azospirillum sp. B506 TaxID=137721 RepID=UPI0003482CC0|nr:lysozyme inhibitor LprI family protein [Azospirillum sp. B506]
MRVLSLVGGLLAAGSLFAVLTAVPALSAQADMSSPEAATHAPPDCEGAETPVAKLICRDPTLATAGAALDAALAALAATTDDTGRAAIEDAQTVWRARRDEACQVTAADLADAKATKTRSECLARVIRQRTIALETETQARSRPVADLPLSVSGAATRRFSTPEPQGQAFNRKVVLSTLAAAGRRPIKRPHSDR